MQQLLLGRYDLFYSKRTTNRAIGVNGSVPSVPIDSYSRISGSRFGIARSGTASADDFAISDEKRLVCGPRCVNCRASSGGSCGNRPSIPLRAAFSMTMRALGVLPRQVRRPSVKQSTERWPRFGPLCPRPRRSNANRGPPTALEQLHLAAGIVEPTSTEAVRAEGLGRGPCETTTSSGSVADGAGRNEQGSLKAPCAMSRPVDARRHARRSCTSRSVPRAAYRSTPIGEHHRRRTDQDFFTKLLAPPRYDALKLHNEMTMLLNGRRTPRNLPLPRPRQRRGVVLNRRAGGLHGLAHADAAGFRGGADC